MNLLETYLSLIEAEQDYAYFNALRTSSGQDTEVICRSVRGPFSCIFDPTRPESPYYNRAILLPSTETATESEFSQLPPSVHGVEILIPQQTEEISKCLMDAGFHPGPSLCYLVTEPEEERLVEHRVERFRSDQAEEFFDLLELSGAVFPKTRRHLKQTFYCTEEFRCHVAYSENGEPTGWATAFLCKDGESLFFANAYTLPEFRRQGFHAALMQVRLNEVITLGRKRAFTDVEAGSQSHQNAERLGFRIVTNNIIWHREQIR